MRVSTGIFVPVTAHLRLPSHWETSWQEIFSLSPESPALNYWLLLTWIFPQTRLCEVGLATSLLPRNSWADTRRKSHPHQPTLLSSPQSQRGLLSPPKPFREQFHGGPYSACWACVLRSPRHCGEHLATLSSVPHGPVAAWNTGGHKKALCGLLPS